MEDRSTTWARAERAARGLTDGGVGAAVRRYYTTVSPGILLASAVAVAVGIFISGYPVWGSTLAFGTVSLAGGGLLIGGFIYASKRVNPLVTPDRASVIVLLGKEDSKNIRRQINGSLPTEPEQLTVSRGAAIQLLQGMALQLLITPGQLLIFASGILIDAEFRPLWAFLALTPVVALIVMFRQFRKTLSFLDETRPAGAAG